MKHKAYISGQISGLPESEYTDLFGRVEANLMEMGFDPVNPLKVPACEGEGCNTDDRKESGEYLHAWQCYMKYDLAALLECEYFFTLPNHTKSRGAMLEYRVATEIGLVVCHFDSSLNTFTREGDRR